MGPEWCPEPHWKFHRALPVWESYAVKNPSASPVNTRPPPVASTPATMGDRAATSHLILPVVTSMALKEPEAWLSISVSELPQYGCPLMKKALPEVNLAQLLITGTKAVLVTGSNASGFHSLPPAAPGQTRTPAAVGRAAGFTTGRPVLGSRPSTPLVRSVQFTSQNGLP